MRSLFELEDVTYRYENVTALHSLSLRIEAGQRVALLGANGSGKSTLLRLLDGLYFPAAGRLRFNGELLTEARFDEDDFAYAFRRQVGMVFQNPDVQLFSPTVFDEVAFGPLQMRWPKAEILAKVSEAMQAMEISHLKDRPPHRLSGGEKKRVALASVLVLEPKALLLDEPTAALDPHSQGHMVDLLSSWKDSGRTVVTATHDLDSVEATADYCFVFHAGTLAAQGVPAAILSDFELLERAGILHAHRHVHSTGQAHSHPHRHGDHHGTHSHQE